MKILGSNPHKHGRIAHFQPVLAKIHFLKNDTDRHSSIRESKHWGKTDLEWTIAD